MDSLMMLGSWTALAMVATISPGPDTALVIGHAARRGQRAGRAAALGVATGNLWYAALFGFGLMHALTLLPMVYLGVKLAGAAYLAWIGVKMLRGALYLAATASNATSGGKPFRDGFLSNVLNPKIALFFLAAIPQFVGNGPDASRLGVLLILINAVINGVWLLIVAAGVSKAGGQLQHSRAIRWLEGLAGAGLIGLAGKTAFARSRNPA